MEYIKDRVYELKIKTFKNNEYIIKKITKELDKLNNKNKIIISFDWHELVSSNLRIDTIYRLIQDKIGKCEVSMRDTIHFTKEIAIKKM